MEEEGDAHHGGYPHPAFLQSTHTELVNGEMAVASSSKNPEKSSSTSKRDEWSEGGVTSLLDIYESKWLLRNRAKLKGSDWEDIARQVSARSCGTKPLKTPNQCKNKIESMKKRYRAESSGVQAGGLAASSWQFYSRMDNLLRGLSCPPQSRFSVGHCFDGVVEPALTDLGLPELPKVELDESDDHLKQMLPIKLQDHIGAPVAIAEEGVVGLQDSDRDDGSNTLVPNHQKAGESDTSTPKSKVANDDCGSREGVPFKRRRGSSEDVAGESDTSTCSLSHFFLSLLLFRRRSLLLFGFLPFPPSTSSSSLPLPPPPSSSSFCFRYLPPPPSVASHFLLLLPSLFSLFCLPCCLKSCLSQIKKRGRAGKSPPFIQSPSLLFYLLFFLIVFSVFWSVFFPRLFLSVYCLLPSPHVPLRFLPSSSQSIYHFVSSPLLISRFLLSPVSIFLNYLLLTALISHFSSSVPFLLP